MTPPAHPSDSPESLPGPRAGGTPRDAALSGPVLLAAVGVAHLVLAQLTVRLTEATGAATGLWPAGGLAIAVLLLQPARRWGWVLAGVAAGEAASDLWAGHPPDVAIGLALASVAGLAAGGTVVRRLGNARGRLAPLRDLLAFLAGAVAVAPLVGATAAWGALRLAGAPEVPGSWGTYLYGAALGVLVVAPAILAARTGGPARDWRETAALAAAAVAACGGAFTDWAGLGGHDTWYVLIPVFTWAALRYGVRGTSLTALVVAAAAVGAGVAGEGPFAARDPSLEAFQGLLGITVASSLVLAALVGELRERTEVEAALRHRATHDPLTGLPNRAVLAQALAARRSPDGTPWALLVCDIDHLKAANDSLGHRGGDIVITTIAGRLAGAVRPGDLVSRISGDEFVVLLAGAGEDRAREIADRLLAAVRRPIPDGPAAGRAPSVSIGIAVGDASVDAERVFAGADTALFEAKRRGRGCAVFFDEELSRWARERQAIEAALPDAIAGGGITCLHQPEVVLATGEVFGFEALARWDHPELGAVGPDRFMPAVEATGNAGPLFASVLEQTLDAQALWERVLGRWPAVSVNLSALQLRDPGLPDLVARALARAGAPADSLWLELTESALAEDAVPGALDALSALGVHLALDDFGTGWSSIARLSEHRWEIVKLDRTFISRLGPGGRPEDEHVVRAMIVMAHAIGMRVVAEGVETDEQLTRLRAMGCDIAQGFLFSRPLDAARAATVMGPDGYWIGLPDHAAARPERLPEDDARPGPAMRPPTGRR